MLTPIVLTILGIAFGLVAGATAAVWWALNKMEVIEIVRHHAQKSYNQGWEDGRASTHKQSYNMGFTDGKASAQTLD